MKATRRLEELGQSLWLDNITRGILNDGTLRRCVDEMSVTGLTSDPTIFDHALANGESYDEAIRLKTGEGRWGEAHRRARRPNLFIEIPAMPAAPPAIEASIFAGVPVNMAAPAG